MKKTFKIALAVTGIIIGSIVILLMIQILQNGIGGWNGRSLDEQLGMPADKARYDDIKNLSKSKLIQLFYAAGAPDVYKLEGEYRGDSPQVGILICLGNYFTKNIYGEGDVWIGKGFVPNGSDRCRGYNLFESKDQSGNTVIVRKRPMANYVSTSNIDSRDSYMIDYTPYNSGLVHYLRDELRKINDVLYIGMGYLNFPGGACINYPFILHGTPGKTTVIKN